MSSILNRESLLHRIPQEMLTRKSLKHVEDILDLEKPAVNKLNLTCARPKPIHRHTQRLSLTPCVEQIKSKSPFFQGRLRRLFENQKTLNLMYRKQSTRFPRAYQQCFSGEKRAFRTEERSVASPNPSDTLYERSHNSLLGFRLCIRLNHRLLILMVQAYKYF
jgi:hypothetical protein